MRNLLHWLDTAIAAQPFYAVEIGLIRLTFKTWRYKFRNVDHFLPG